MEKSIVKTFNVLGSTFCYKDAEGRNIYDNLHITIKGKQGSNIPLKDQDAYVYTYHIAEDHRDKKPPMFELMEGKQVVEFIDPAADTVITCLLKDLLDWEHTEVYVDEEEYAALLEYQYYTRHDRAETIGTDKLYDKQVFHENEFKEFWRNWQKGTECDYLMKYKYCNEFVDLVVGIEKTK